MQRHMPHPMHTAKVCATIISRPVQEIAHLDRATILVTLAVTVTVAVTVNVTLTVLVT